MSNTVIPLMSEYALIATLKKDDSESTIYKNNVDNTCLIVFSDCGLGPDRRLLVSLGPETLKAIKEHF